MTDQLNGLRFDIYERVHLQDEAAAIEELEEIELVPHMQAIHQDDQVLLRGHLLLSGVYKAQGESELSRLEHWIPVEISLPLNRVERVEDLAVEIDNFDVDLLSARSLNVTGVLALRGLQLESTGGTVWRDDSFTVVHQAPYETSLGEPFAGGQPLESYGGQAENQSNWPEKPQTDERLDFVNPAEVAAQINSESTYDWNTPERLIDWQNKPERGRDERVSEWQNTPERVPEAQNDPEWLREWQNPERVREAQNDPEQLREWQNDPYAELPGISSVSLQGSEDFARAVYGVPAVEPEVEESAKTEVPGVEQWGDLSAIPSPAAEPDVSDDFTAQEERVELKVAVGGKQLAAEAPFAATGVGLLAQLGEKGALREVEQRIQAAKLAEDQAKEESVSKESSGDEIEWTRLFLAVSSKTDAGSFRKVRICIVQRDETLETIASRYNVQARELQLYNRLADPYLSEGQVLYIP